jgi:quinoprotein glucose dehydrogenase
MGLVFVLDRATGTPLFPVEERSVPKSDVPGETASPTQPFPVRPPPLVPPLEPTKAFGFTPFDKGDCKAKLEALRYEGMYTPPSLKGTALYPFTGGGINWGGIAIDPERQILVTNTMRMVHEITLIPQDRLEAEVKARPDAEYGRQRGAPYAMRRDLVRSALGAPCNSPPWGMIHAIDLKTGTIKWEHPLGTAQDLVLFGDLILPKGVPNVGGPMLTAAGLIFIAATHDHFLRAFSTGSGEELWRGRLPAGGQATPMSYSWQGRQYVVIAAGGYGKFPANKPGDYVLAYALPEKNR